MDDVVKLGIVGTSSGNGHPYSFAAIVNGYDSRSVRAAGWGAIADYLDVRRRDEFGINGVRVTHAWCPTRSELADLCAATGIEHPTANLAELARSVDGVLIARDDWQSHLPIALPMLKSGVPVFVDKPLTLDQGELDILTPFLESGQLMTGSGLRFAPELDVFAALDLSVSPLIVNAVGPCDWDRYALHLLEPALIAMNTQVQDALSLQTSHDAVAFTCINGAALTVHCVGSLTSQFALDLVGPDVRYQITLADRFTAFRRLLEAFVAMIESGEPSLDPSSTLDSLDALLLGRAAIERPNAGAVVRLRS